MSCHLSIHTFQIEGIEYEETNAGESPLTRGLECAVPQIDNELFSQPEVLHIRYLNTLFIDSPCCPCIALRTEIMIFIICLCLVDEYRCQKCHIDSFSLPPPVTTSPHPPLNLIDTHLFSPSNRTHHVIWCVWTQSRKSKHSRVVDRVTLGSSSQVESRPLTAGWDDTEQSYTELFAPDLNDQTWTFRCVCAAVGVVAGRVGLSAEHVNTCREKTD